MNCVYMTAMDCVCVTAWLDQRGDGSHQERGEQPGGVAAQAIHCCHAAAWAQAPNQNRVPAQGRPGTILTYSH